MKYYHLIYNSSERSIKGAPGFGIHTYSEDLPKEILSAIEKDPELFAFQYKGAQLNPNSLCTNPEAIKEIIPTWIYATLPTGDGKTVHILGRKIAVGFDYSYYKTGQPTRLGNYVGDYYITTDTPSADFWNLMYKREEGTQLLPASPVPTQDNDDMRSISLGEPHLLPPANDIAAPAPKSKGASEYAIEIVFGILESRKQHKPLLIKMPSAETAETMADVFRLLPVNIATECPFTTNYHQMGRRQGYNIFVINEAYQGQIMAEQWVAIDLINGNTVKNKERDTFFPIIKSYSDRGVWDYARSTVTWILSDFYANMRNQDSRISSLVLSYINKDEFDFESLPQDLELIKALSPIVMNDEEKKDYLFDHLYHDIRAITNPEQIREMSRKLTVLKPLGTDDIAKEWMPDATRIAFESQSAFTALYYSVRGDLDSVANVIDYSECAKHDQYLSAFAHYPDVWRMLRPRFLPNAASNHESFVLRAINEGFDYENTLKAVKEVNPDMTKFIDSLVSIYKKFEQDGATGNEAMPEERNSAAEVSKKAIDFICRAVKSVDYYPFIEKMPGKYDNDVCLKLYLWDIQNNIARKTAAISINVCKETLKSLSAIFENAPSFKDKVLNFSNSSEQDVAMTGEIVSRLSDAYITLLSKDSGKDIGEIISREIESIDNLFSISHDKIGEAAQRSRLAKALYSIFDTYSILKLDTDNVTEAQIRKAIGMKRISFVKATIPTVLKWELNPEMAEFVATEYVECNAITSDELLKEVQKREYGHNRHSIWAITLKDLHLKPADLVKKIAGLYEAPDNKGKFSKAAVDHALRFMRECMPEDYNKWDKKNNSAFKNFFGAIRSIFKKSPEKTKTKRR